jgi:hypothetical protein
MSGEEKVGFVYDGIRYLHDNDVPGDIVECGVWKGGTSMAMALSALRFGASRVHYLFDTFDGLPPPDEHDDERSLAIHEELQDAKRGVLSNRVKELLDKGWISADFKWNKGAYDEVHKNMIASGLPMERVRFVRGKVEDTLAVESNLPKQIALLRLDTDLYASTKAELDVLYPRVAPGGIVTIDDYGRWGGATMATDEYLLAHSEIQVHWPSPFGMYWIKPT